MPALRDWSEHSCCLPPNMLPRCHCGGPTSPCTDTMPKLASAASVPAYAHSSHSGRGMAWASLDDEDACEDDFQTLHMSFHHIVWWDGGSHGELAIKRMEASRGSSSWQPYYQVDVGEKEAEMLESINPHWRTTRWLQVVVQGIIKEEVPWYELVILLMSGVEGVALSLAKCLLTVWRWNIRAHREDACPPTRTILNISQFNTEEQVAEGVGEPHWFVAYSCALQQVGKAAHRQKWERPMGEVLEVKVSPLVLTF